MYQKWKRRSVLLSNNKTRKSLNSAPHALGSDLFIENTDFLTLFALINAQVWPLDPLCYFRISQSHNQWLQSGQWLSQGISVLMSAPRVSLWQFSILRKQELHCSSCSSPSGSARSPEAAGSRWVSVRAMAAPIPCPTGLLIQFAKENQPNLPIWLYVSLESNLTPWDLACWDLQLFDVHKGNGCSAMKSSQAVMSAHFWLHRSKRRNLRGREMEGWHHWAAKKP